MRPGPYVPQLARRFGARTPATAPSATRRRLRTSRHTVRFACAWIVEGFARQCPVAMDVTDVNGVDYSFLYGMSRWERSALDRELAGLLDADAG